MQETRDIWVWSLDQEDPLEEGITTYSSILAWKIPWTEEPGGLQFIGLQSQTWLKWLSMHTHTVSWTFTILSEYFFWAGISVVPPKNLPHWLLVLYVQWIWCVGGICFVQWIWGSWIHSCISFHVKCVLWSDAMLLRILFPKPWIVTLAEAVWAGKANPYREKISVPVMMNHWNFHLPYRWWGTLSYHRSHLVSHFGY